MVTGLRSHRARGHSWILQWGWEVLWVWTWGGSTGDRFLVSFPDIKLRRIFLRQLGGSAAQEEGGCPPGSVNGLTSKAGGKAALPQGRRRVVVLYEWERRT